VSIEDLIITTFCLIEDELQQVTRAGLWPFLSSSVEFFKVGCCQRRQTDYHVFRSKNTWSKRVDNRDFSSFGSIFI
jgi:hypothetical protein